MAGCFEYYAGLAEKLDERQYTPVDVGMEDFSVKVGAEASGSYERECVGLMGRTSNTCAVACGRAGL